MSSITIAERPITTDLRESMILLGPHRKFATEARESALNLTYENEV
jgi:hypothetical protein